MIKMHCRHCGNLVIPRQIKAKGRHKIHTEAWCPDCNVAIKSMNAAERKAAAAPELHGVKLPHREAGHNSAQALKKIKAQWGKLSPTDRWKLYEWMDGRERQEAHGQA